ncbi:hypothetical protein [Ponticaulis profundi]|uniref:DUF2959 domain-containing protein n=1 Tax=Ponticaulis profundi TaxID=2665222 RepID=A0ABW1S6H3_9PROT
MRNLYLAAAFLCLGGCATVTIQPANFTMSLNEEQSELTKSAKAFADNAEAEGWIKKSDPIAFLQSKLFPSSDAGDNTPEYVEQLKENSASQTEYRQKLMADMASATASLTELNTTAETTLAGEMQPERADVASFEDALIAAQKCRKSFADAKDELATSVEMDRTLAGLDAEIETTRRLADDLAAAWQNDLNAIS